LYKNCTKKKIVAKNVNLNENSINEILLFSYLYTYIYIFYKIFFTYNELKDKTYQKKYYSTNSCILN